MSERFFTASPILGQRAILDGPEAHHLARVMRAKIGQEVTLFDNSGCEFTAQVASIGKSQIELNVLRRESIDRESAVQLTLAVALPKGERQRFLIEKLVELGAAALIPLITQRGVAQPTDSAIERLRRGVIEASKQCGRNRLMEIQEPQPWLKFASGTEAEKYPQRLLAHPGGTPLGEVLPGAKVASNDSMERRILAAVGPEGGFADEEIAAAVAAGWKAVDLGSRILRVETAATAIAAWAAWLP